MPDVAVVQTSSVGVSVAVTTVGAAVYQLVKLVDGAAGSSTPIAATSGVPAAGTMGLVVAVKDGASVTIQQGASVSAAVSGTVTVAGSVSVSGAAQVSGTVSVSGAIAGTVSISGVAPWTTGNDSWFSTPAIPVVLNQSARVTIGAVAITIPVIVSGSVQIVTLP